MLPGRRMQLTLGRLAIRASCVDFGGHVDDSAAQTGRGADIG
jgi:hypothetical protein